MKNRQEWLLIINLLVTICGYGQSINGSVVNTTTQQRVPFVNIYCPSTKTGTLSNENGEFEIRMQSFPVQLIISHLTFQTDTITFTEPTTNYVIHLEAAAHELGPVTVSNAGYKLIEQVFNQIKANKSIIYGKAFYRQLTKNGGQATEIQEVMYSVKLSSNKIEGVQIDNARYAKLSSNDEKMYFNFVNFSYLALGQKAIRQEKPTANSVLFPVSNDVVDYYDVRITNMIEQANGDKIAELDCQVREDYMNPAFSGKVYINTANNSLVKLHGTILNSLGAAIDNSKTLTNNHIYTIDTDYTSQFNSIVFNNIRITYECDQLTRKTGEKRRNRVSAFLLISDFSDVPLKAKYKRVDIHREDLKIIQQSKYDSNFWRVNSAVRRTPLEENTIKTFEQQGVMGNMKFDSM